MRPDIDPRQGLDQDVVFRADPAFAKPEIGETPRKLIDECTLCAPADDSLRQGTVELWKPGLEATFWWPSRSTSDGYWEAGTGLPFMIPEQRKLAGGSVHARLKLGLL